MILTPIVLFIGGCTATTLIIALAAFAIHYYIKAKEIAPYLLQLEEVQRRIAEAQTTLEETRRAIREKVDELAQAERFIADGSAAKEWLEREAPKIEALKLAVEAEQQKLRTANDAYQKRQVELDELTQQVADKNTELRTATEKKDALDIETARLTQEIGSLKAQIAAAQEQFAALNTQVEALRNEKNTLDAQVKELKERADRLERQMREDKAARDTVRTELANAQDEVARLKGEANGIKGVMAEWDKRQELNAERWKDLDAPYITNTTPLKASNVKENEWLQAFQDNLNTHKIRFNERSVKAFHTGLKCADVSSLVVLAGISGTGKSLLPELYAAALGMNFLSVAVQPRWDSPQDLLGFYNYMEGRYKATELARLLWQFDRYNNPPKKTLQHVPMNLVLLDEMNLARVEYYFSDLLSKLETRNGLDPKNPDQRRNAEIEIECGALGTQEVRRRLFVDRNTLFVGTMNEDESTQTLSDKVIDRSNVLRFGRPETLGLRPKKKEFLDSCGKTRITETNWLEWCERDEQLVEKMKILLEPLNPVLDGVGRPFAHRTWLAMESYIALYPGDTDADFNAAVADQIEMKILPKLNGLELDAAGFNNVKNTLSNIIEDLQDEKLTGAFTLSCDATHNSFFKWRGVMR